MGEESPGEREEPDHPVDDAEPTHSTTALGKRLAERRLTIGKEGPPKRRRAKQVEVDSLAQETMKVEERSGDVLRTMLSESLDKLIASNTAPTDNNSSSSPTAAAIEIFKAELKDEFSTGNDVFKVYRLLRQQEMAETFLVLEDTERADWLRFELGGGMIHG